MGDKAKTRAEMVALLVDHALAMAGTEEQRHWLRSIFEKGFTGYSKLSSSQLTMEMQLHGLDETADLYEETDDDDLEFQMSGVSGFSDFSRSESC